MRFFQKMVMLTALFVCMPLIAQVPAGATGQCKDNSYTTAAKKWQACAGHKGVLNWYADAKPAGVPAAAAGTPTPTQATSASTSVPARTVPAAGKTSAAAAAAQTAAAPGGGPGLVWVNTATKVYHCPGATFYGKTKEGKYMSEADAKKAGARPDRNKVCSN